MNAVSPLHDASVCGSLANATLCGAPAPKEPTPREATAPDDAAPRVASAPQSVPCQTKWRRLMEALLSPISGPTFPSCDASRH